MKKCKSCEIEKELSEFSKHKNRPDGVNFYCKECMKVKIKAAERTKIGVIRHIFASQKRSSLKRKMSLPSYTLEELVIHTLPLVEFNDMYNEWKKSNYETFLKPSYDRKDYSLPYSLDNIKLMTWGENFNRQKSENGNKTSDRVKFKVAVNAYKDGVLMHSFDSLTKAAKFVGISHPNDITSSIIRNGTAGGYVWKYQ